MCVCLVTPTGKAKIFWKSPTIRTSNNLMYIPKTIIHTEPGDAKWISANRV